MSKGNFECNKCGHTATFSKKQMLEHMRNHREVATISHGFSENNLVVKDLLLDGPVYGKEVSN